MTQPITIWRTADGLYASHGKASRNLAEVAQNLIDIYGPTAMGEVVDLDTQRELSPADAFAADQRLYAAEAPAPRSAPRPKASNLDPKTWSPAMAGSMERLDNELRESGQRTVVGSPEYRASLPKPTPKPPAPAAQPKSQETAMTAPPSDDDRRRALAQSIQIALTEGANLMNSGIWSLAQYERLQQKAKEAVAEAMPMEVYKKMRLDEDGNDSEVWNNFEKTFRTIPNGVNPDQWSRDGDQVMREVTAAAAGNAWLQGHLSDEAAQATVASAMHVPDHPDGAGWAMYDLVTGFLAADDATRLKLEAPRPPEREEWGEIPSEHLKEWHDRNEADPTRPAGRHRDKPYERPDDSPAPSIAEAMGLPPIEYPTEKAMRQIRAARGIPEREDHWRHRRSKTDSPAPSVEHGEGIAQQHDSGRSLAEISLPASDANPQ